MNEMQSIFDQYARQQAKIFDHEHNWKMNGADAWALDPDAKSMLQVITYVSPISQFTTRSPDKPQYMFFVMHKCVFSSEKLWVVDHVHDKGYYVSEYEIETNAVSAGRKLARSEVVLVENRPEQTLATETYSGGMSESFGGNIGFFGNTPTGGLSGSVTTSENISFAMKDVTVYNVSDSDSDHPGSHWKFQLKPATPGSQDFWGQQNLNYPADLGTKTFQPILLEYWELPYGKIGTDFELEMKITTKIRWDHIDTSPSGNHHKWHWFSHWITNNIVCPYAPDPPTKP